MTPPRAEPSARLRAAVRAARRWGAVLAEPDRYPLHERSSAWLALALAVSIAAHLALVTSIAAQPWQFGREMRLVLRATLAPAAAPAEVEPAPATETPASRPAEDAAPPKPAQDAAAARPEEAPRATPPEGAAASTIPERYFQRRELDEPAQPLGRMPLIYPQGALHLGVRGTVRVRVFIAADGRVERVDVVAVDPPGHQFEVAALEAMRLMRYSGALKNGQRVPSQKLVDVVFDPDERAPGG